MIGKLLRETGWVALVAVAVWGMPQQAVAQASLFTEGQGARRGPLPAWDTVWVFHGDDNALASATSLLPDSRGGVVFLDQLLLEVHRLDAQGRLDWSWGREGSGPGEVRAIRAMALDGDGNVVLVDYGNRRIVTLSPEGRLLREVPLAIDAGSVAGVAVLQSDRYVMATDGAAPWILVNQDGQQVQEVESPQALAQLSPLQRMGLITKWKQDHWVFGLQNGNGWFTFRSGAMALASPYVEHTGFPPHDAVRLPIGETVHSAVSLSVHGDTLAVLFAGSTRGQLHLLDRYDLQTGDYLNSLVLPQPVKQAVVGSQGTVFVVTYDLFPTVMALRPSPSLSLREGNPPP
jgi:outer membrane protein assembly factor BamB